MRDTPTPPSTRDGNNDGYKRGGSEVEDVPALLATMAEVSELEKGYEKIVRTACAAPC